MVFTFGFLSILTFAGILASSGYIASAIVDDLLVRFNLRILTREWAACILWGLLYYGWMIIIAVVTVAWKQTRLQLTSEEFDLRDGYWFAYISSTTVGLVSSDWISTTMCSLSVPHRMVKHALLVGRYLPRATDDSLRRHCILLSSVLDCVCARIRVLG